jgi:hypothetical protein
MKKVILSILFLAALPLSIILSGCSMGSSTIKPVRLGEALPIMKDFEGIPTLDGIQQNVTYSEVGMSQYDLVFKNIAILNAKIVQYNFLITKYGTNPQDLIKEAAIAKISTSSIKDSPAELTLMLGSVGSLKSQLGALNPQSDFTGLNATKIPNVTSSLAKAMDNLKDAATQIPQLIDGMTKIANAL